MSEARVALGVLDPGDLRSGRRRGSTWSLLGKRDGRVIKKDTGVSSVNEWILWRIENQNGFKRAVLRADIELRAPGSPTA